jgi:hypothetical protein
MRQARKEEASFPRKGTVHTELGSQKLSGVSRGQWKYKPSHQGRDKQSHG